MWGLRVVVPESYQQSHGGAPYQPSGNQRNEILGSYIYGGPPYVDAGIEHKVASCTACQSARNTPAKAMLHPWACMAYLPVATNTCCFHRAFPRNNVPDSMW